MKLVTKYYYIILSIAFCVSDSICMKHIEMKKIAKEEKAPAHHTLCSPFRVPEHGTILVSDMYFLDGIYDGEVLGGERHGSGKMFFYDYSVYEGDWEKDKMHGKGEITFPNKTSYRGDFVNGIPHGSGEFKSSAGRSYKGDFVDGKPHGHGKIKFDGYSYDGGFADGTYSGYGEVEYPDGKCEEKYFVDGKTQ